MRKTWCSVVTLRNCNCSFTNWKDRKDFFLHKVLNQLWGLISEARLKRTCLMQMEIDLETKLIIVRVILNGLGLTACRCLLPSLLNLKELIPTLVLISIVFYLDLAGLPVPIPKRVRDRLLRQAWYGAKSSKLYRATKIAILQSCFYRKTISIW